MSSADQVYEALRALPDAERLRIVERVIRELADAASCAAAESERRSDASVVGLWADDADLVDRMVDGIMSDREGRRLRA